MISCQTEFFSLFCFSARLPVPPDRFCAENKTPEYFLQKVAVHQSCDEAETCRAHSRCKFGVTQSNPGVPSHTGAAPTPPRLHRYHRRILAEPFVPGLCLIHRTGRRNNKEEHRCRPLAVQACVVFTDN